MSEALTDHLHKTLFGVQSMYDAPAQTGHLQLGRGVALTPTPTPGSPFQAAPSHDTGHSNPSNPGLFNSSLLNPGLHCSSGHGSNLSNSALHQGSGHGSGFLNGSGQLDLGTLTGQGNAGLQLAGGTHQMSHAVVWLYCCWHPSDV